MTSLTPSPRTIRTSGSPVEPEAEFQRFVATVAEAVAAGGIVEVVGRPGDGLHHRLLSALKRSGLCFITQEADVYERPIGGIDVDPLRSDLFTAAAQARTGMVVLVLMNVDERLPRIQREALEHLVATLPAGVQAVVTTRYEHDH